MEDQDVKKIREILISTNGSFIDVTRELNSFSDIAPRATSEAFVLAQEFDVMTNDIMNLYAGELNWDEFRDSRKQVLALITSLLIILKNTLGEVQSFFSDLKPKGGTIEYPHKFLDLEQEVKNKDFLSNIRKTMLQLEKQIVIAKGFKADYLNNIKKEQEEELAKKLASLDAAKRAYDGEKTKEVYVKAFDRYSKSAKNYEVAFYGACLVSVVSTILVGVLIHEYPDWLYEVIGMKVILALVLITLFLRRISHYRKLADEANQKSLELSALPSFMREVKEEDQKEIYKELAGKYFGGGIDHSQNDKIGNLIDDQIKNIVELSRATIETVKGLKEVADPSSNKSERQETKLNDDGK